MHSSNVQMVRRAIDAPRSLRRSKEPSKQHNISMQYSVAIDAAQRIDAVQCCHRWSALVQVAFLPATAPPTAPATAPPTATPTPTATPALSAAAVTSASATAAALCPAQRHTGVSVQQCPVGHACTRILAETPSLPACHARARVRLQLDGEKCRKEQALPYRVAVVDQRRRLCRDSDIGRIGNVGNIPERDSCWSLNQFWLYSLFSYPEYKAIADLVSGQHERKSRIITWCAKPESERWAK